jgi:hypothetical protein
MVPILADVGVVLAGPSGCGGPVISDEEIAFNSVRACGHAARDFGVAWPAKAACGVCLAYQEGRESDVAGPWKYGQLLHSRSCAGDCSHGPLSLRRVLPCSHQPRNDWVLDLAVTGFKAFDLAVQVCLVIASHHLGSAIMVSSDGGPDLWVEAQLLCEGVLGYGSGFSLVCGSERGWVPAAR